MMQFTNLVQRNTQCMQRLIGCRPSPVFVRRTIPQRFLYCVNAFCIIFLGLLNMSTVPLTIPQTPIHCAQLRQDCRPLSRITPHILFKNTLGFRKLMPCIRDIPSRHGPHPSLQMKICSILYPLQCCFVGHLLPAHKPNIFQLPKTHIPRMSCYKLIYRLLNLIIRLYVSNICSTSRTVSTLFYTVFAECMPTIRYRCLKHN
mmetsp:Transcript_3563/g.7254  ORF Transcript_3563/g.7254 Transcript_3563/m.7254 type:complete len:202 (-) Transcript_3563:1614-2219(-)